MSVFCAPSDAHAGRLWWWAKTSGGSNKKNWSVSLDLSLRIITHYNKEITLFTPPQTVVGEVQVPFWFRSMFGIAAIAGKSVAQASTQYFGAGLKLPFLSMASPVKSFVTGISMQIMFDGIQFSTAPPTGDQLYTSQGFVIRYGGGILWALGSKGLYLNTTMMANKFSGSFIIAPGAGFGYTF